MVLIQSIIKGRAAQMHVLIDFLKDVQYLNQLIFVDI